MIKRLAALLIALLVVFSLFFFGFDLVEQSAWRKSGEPRRQIVLVKSGVGLGLKAERLFLSGAEHVFIFNAANDHHVSYFSKFLRVAFEAKRDVHWCVPMTTNVTSAAVLQQTYFPAFESPPCLHNQLFESGGRLPRVFDFKHYFQVVGVQIAFIHGHGFDGKIGSQLPLGGDFCYLYLLRSGLRVSLGDGQRGVGPLGGLACDCDGRLSRHSSSLCIPSSGKSRAHRDEAKQQTYPTYYGLALASTGGIKSSIRSLPLNAKVAVAAILAIGATGVFGFGFWRFWESNSLRRELWRFGVICALACGLVIAYAGWTEAAFVGG